MSGYLHRRLHASTGVSCLGLLAGVALAGLVVSLVGAELGLPGALGATAVVGGLYALRTRDARRAAGERARLKARVGDPRHLRGLWRAELRRAWAAFDAYGETVAGMPDGPLRDRLGDATGQLTAGLVRCGELARHGAALEARLKGFSPRDLRRQLGRVRRQQRRDPFTDLAGTLGALEAQLSSAETLRRQAAQARRELQVHVNTMSGAAAQAAQLRLQAAAAVGDPAGPAADLRHELAALAEAMATLTAAPAPAGHPRPRRQAPEPLPGPVGDRPSRLGGTGGTPAGRDRPQGRPLGG